MTSLERKDIAKHFPGRNLVTPDIIEYGQVNNFIYELSSGLKPFSDKTKRILVYGVTICEKTSSDQFIKRSDLTEYFGTELENAYTYINNLKNL